MSASSPPEKRKVLRERDGTPARVTYLELFFDLVFVFAITQISHFLHDHQGWIGTAQGAVLFFAVWWAWMSTTWAANRADPDRISVRVLLIILMLLSMGMSIGLPGSFGPNATLFAGCYVALQIGRSFLAGLLFRRECPELGRDMVLIGVWYCLSAPLWIFGSLADPATRLLVWLSAVAIEGMAPLLRYPVPWLGRTTDTERDIEGGHLAERSALFIIIALGEGIVVIGTEVIEAGIAFGTMTAFAVSFASSVLMWWLYFDVGAVRGAEHIEQHRDPGKVALSVYTYIHMPIIAGIVVYALADSLILEEWNGTASRALVLAQSLGGVLFLAGLGVFKRYSSPKTSLFPSSHRAGLALFGALACAGWLMAIPTLLFAGAGAAIFALAASWEWVAYHGLRAHARAIGGRGKED